MHVGSEYQVSSQYGTNLAWSEEGLEQVTLGATEFDHRQAVFNPDALQHAVNMVLDGLFGEAQLGSNLLIGQTLRDQRQQLLLASRESKLYPDPHVGQPGRLLGHVTE